MPSRPVIVLILAAWLATAGWFINRELWPLLFPGDAPPFVIELADEVTSEIGGDRRRPDVLWTITRNDKPIGRAETRLRYFREDNTYEIETRLSRLKLPVVFTEVEIPEMFTAYRVDRHGRLRSMRMDGSMSLMSIAGKASVRGEVRGDLLHRSGELDIPFVDRVPLDLPPIDAPTGSVLSPMHPVPKIKGLKPGRRWRMPLINPLGDVIEPSLQAVWAKLQPGKKFPIKLPQGPAYVDAEVLDETAEIVVNHVSHTCRIIEYRTEGESRPARTYVRISDDAVLRQEAYAMGEKIVLQRE